MRILLLSTIYIILCTALVSCSAGAGNSDSSTADTAGVIASQAVDEDTDSPEPQKRGATPPLTPALPIATVNAMPAYTEVQPVAEAAPARVVPGMKVSEALRVPGATQTVSAIMTGGKITGTVVIQWKGKSWYTNVDFAEEGGFANGTHYTTPEDVQAFIEVACSDGAVPADFTDDAIVTEQIR